MPNSLTENLSTKLTLIQNCLEHPVLDKALPKVTQLQGFQSPSKSQRAKLGCSQIVGVPLGVFRAHVSAPLRVYH
jgi:hypothetical protein